MALDTHISAFLRTPVTTSRGPSGTFMLVAKGKQPVVEMTLVLSVCMAARHRRRYHKGPICSTNAILQARTHTCTHAQGYKQ